MGRDWGHFFTEIDLFILVLWKEEEDGKQKQPKPPSDHFGAPDVYLGCI